MKYIQIVFYAVILNTLFTACQEAPSTLTKASLIVQNGSIWTGNEAQMHAEAMAISGDSILAIGTNDAIEEYKDTNTEILDAKGRFITPGFIDSHVHLMTGGRSLLSVELRDAKTPKEFTKRIADFTKTIKKGEWILEGNWDHTLWGGELPNRAWIDEHTKDNPVVIYRLDGHMVLANSAALEYAGMDDRMKDMDGGKFIRNADGTLTGILKNKAMDLILDKIPPMNPVQKEQSFKAAMNYFSSNGVTSVHDVDGMNNHFESYSTAYKLRTSGDLDVRIYAAKPLHQWKELLEMERTDDKWLKTGCLKGFVDGSLGSHTAAFHHAYSDKAHDHGFFINETDDLYNWMSNADKENLHIFIHAIGDKAIHTLLNIYERIIKENGKRDRRLRIEHAQHLDPKDIGRFAKLGVVASMQPYHAIDDGRWAEEVIGAERIKTTYAFKSLLDAKATIAFGSDWAVAPAAPIQGIYAAATRRTLDGKNPDGWVPEQKITVLQALKAYTKDAAFASFEEDIKGTLEAGKLADFVVLDQDITKIDPVQIKNVTVLETYVGGKKVFSLNQQ